jgi:hypothetical protein
MLHSFLSLTNRPICIRSALDIRGLSWVIVLVSRLGVYIGQMYVAMSWYSCMIVTTCAAT